MNNYWTTYTALPAWRRYCVVAALIVAAAYLAWLKFSNKPPAPGQTVTAATAKQVMDMPQKRTSPVSVVVIRDKEKATEKLNIPPAQTPSAKEEIFQAVAVPKLKNGGTATVFLNTSTGTGRTVVTANPQPWFVFERGNAVGVEYGIGTKGNYFRSDYRRDFLQVKGVFLSGKVEAEVYDQKLEGKAGARLEYRW